MEQVTITTREAILYTALINLAVGFVLGLIPLLFGYFNRQLKLGVWAILIATFGGAILGIFVSVPAVIIFTWLIFRRSRAVTAERSTVAGADE
jgi:hypothetical protein